ncbi:MAG: hypothetical protein ACOYOS_23510, partial [Syntrophales bacterium]
MASLLKSVFPQKKTVTRGGNGLQFKLFKNRPSPSPYAAGNNDSDNNRNRRRVDDGLGFYSFHNDPSQMWLSHNNPFISCQEDFVRVSSIMV